VTDSELTRPGETAVPCPVCSTPRVAADRYCETCGYDSRAPTWELVIDADRDYHARFAVGELSFPEPARTLNVALDGPEVLIGRRDGDSGPTLTGAVDDPALSRRHARLVRRDDGGYAIEDLGSTNGTEVNGRPIPRGELVELHDGDRMHLGAWTAMVIREVEAD
jgi:FHA domain